ncbi:MAG: rhomboid family intramembrane serine protease [Kiritimatiellia bacterium]
MRFLALLCIVARVAQQIVAAAPVRTVMLGAGTPAHVLVQDPLAFLFAIHGIGLSLGFFWTPFSYVFLHVSWLHLAMNLIGLFVFGSAVETTVGRRTMFRLFFGSGLVGGLAWITASGLASAQPCMGASAAVLGLAGAYAALRPRDEFVLYLPLPIVLTSWQLAVLLLVVNALELRFVESNVAYLAHLAGIVAGIAAGIVLRLLKRDPRSSSRSAT